MSLKHALTHPEESRFRVGRAIVKSSSKVNTNWNSSHGSMLADVRSIVSSDWAILTSQWLQHEKGMSPMVTYAYQPHVLQTDWSRLTLTNQTTVLQENRLWGRFLNSSPIQLFVNKEHAAIAWKWLLCKELIIYATTWMRDGRFRMIIQDDSHQ